jgi:hypothetical protein
MQVLCQGVKNMFAHTARPILGVAKRNSTYLVRTNIEQKHKKA